MLLRSTIRIVTYLLAYSALSLIVDKPAIPDIERLLHDLPGFITSGFFGDLGLTCLRWLLVLLIGSPIAITIGVLFSYSEWLAKQVTFDIDFWRSLPATALVTFIFVILGDNVISRIAPAIYITFFTILYYIIRASSHIIRERLDHLRQLGAGPWFVITQCLIYELLPAITIALRQCVSLSFLVLIASELVIGSAGNRGIGNRFADWFFYTEYSYLLLGLFCLGLIGYLANIVAGAGLSKPQDRGEELAANA